MFGGSHASSGGRRVRRGAAVLAALVLSLAPGIAGCRSAGPREARAGETVASSANPLRAAGLREDQRQELRAAEGRASDLEELRAGELDLSDRDIKIIVITAAAVVLLVLIF